MSIDIRALIRMFCVLCLCCSGHGQAQALVTGELVGASILSISGQDKYLAVLTTDEDLATVEQPSSFSSMIFKVLDEKISARFWNQDLIQRVAINDDEGLLEEHSRQVQAFAEIFNSPLYRDDLIVLKARDDGVLVSLNGVELNMIVGDTFFDLLVNAWIGSVPPSSAFRRQILSKDSIQGALQQLERFSNYSNNRDRALSLKTAFSQATQAKLETKQQAIDLLEREKQAEVQRQQELAAAAAERRAQEQAAIAKRKEQARIARLEEELAATREAERQQKELLALERFQKVLYRHPYPFVKYPARSLQRREQGVVQLDVTIDKQGNLLRAEILETSGFPRLDKAALEAVDAANPFPSLPPEVQQDTVRFPLPLAFQVN